MFTIGMDGSSLKPAFYNIFDVCISSIKDINFNLYNCNYSLLESNPLNNYVEFKLSIFTSAYKFSTIAKNISQNKVQNPIYDDNEIKEIIFGCLLGDGSLEKSINSKNARFKFSQSLKAKEYFLQQFLLFKPYFTDNYNYTNYTYLDKRTNKSYSTLSFSTKALPLFTMFYDLFYLNNNKKIPDQENLKFLTPLALAHWIMQDGSFHKNSKGIYLCTDYFNSSDTLRIATFLTQNFGLKCTTPKAPKGKINTTREEKNLRIYISATNLVQVQTLVFKHMHPSFLYKIGL